MWAAIMKTRTTGQHYTGTAGCPAGMPIDHIRKKVSHLKELLAEGGRDFTEMDVAMQLIVYVGKSHEDAVQRFRRSQMYNHLVSLSKSTLKDQVGMKHEETNLIGTPDEIIEKARKFEAAGVKHLCGLYFCADDVQELLDQMSIFAQEVVPHLQ